MFKKILMSLSFLFAASNALVADIDAYANFYSTTTQTLTLGQPVTFESENEVKKFAISDDRTTIINKHKGRYLITYNAVGIRGSEQPSGFGNIMGDDVGVVWGLALTLNGNIIPGSSVNIYPDSGEDEMIVGQAVVCLKKNDQIRLVNNTHDTGDLSITLVGGDGDGDISASIVLVNLDD
jgi:hypothetical protein